MSPDTSSAPRLQEELRAELAGRSFQKTDVTLLLASDVEIPLETRVALTPHHLVELRTLLEDAGLLPRLLVVRGAGDRAGFADDEYRAVGATIVEPEAFSALEGVDLCHALKEPTRNEGELPGPFLRIGALHLASYPPGVGRLLRRKNFSAILDGGTVGNCSYLKVGGDRTPIVASMSRFAGFVAGERVVEGLEQNGHGPGKIVVVGGGVAGISAIDRMRPKIGRLLVVERHGPSRERLLRTLEEMGLAGFEVLPELTDEALTGAVGLVFAHRTGARAAEKVCTYEQIRRMTPGAAIADIAIDQGGGLLHDGYREDDDALTSRDKYRELLKDFYYFAETNIPRAVPYEASESHGDAAWPYVATLLALSALHGGPREAAEALLDRDVRIFHSGDSLGDWTLLDCLVQDLRNGVQLATNGSGSIVIADPELEHNGTLVEWIQDCARGA